MSSRGFDQRKSYRCPVDEAHQAAELAVGRRRVPIRLYNESAGGFAALADNDPGVSLGDVVGLRTCSGTFEVRVAHMSRVEPAAGDDRGPQSTFQLGLERLRDLASLSELHPQARDALRGIARPRFFPSTAVGTVAIVLLLAAVAMNGVTMWCSAQTPPQPTAAGAFPLSPVQSPGGDPAFAETLGEVGLTQAQQARLRDVAATAAKALQDIDAQWQRDPPEQRMRKQSVLLGAVRREILQSLPEEQRARWKTLSPQP
jgi:hypothetical protein